MVDFIYSQLPGARNATVQRSTSEDTTMTTPFTDFSVISTAITGMSAELQRVLGPLLELGRLFTSEVAYQQDILTKWTLLDQPARAHLYRAVTAIQGWAVRIRDLLTTPWGNNFPGTLAFIDVTIDGAWYDALIQRITDDVFAGDRTRLSELPDDIQDNLRTFQDLLREIKAVHQTFIVHKGLLDELDTLTRNIPPSGQINTGQWPRLKQLSAVLRQGGAQSYQAAALRQMADNDDPAVVNLLAEGLRILQRKMEPRDLDPALQALLTARQRNTARLDALRKKWEYFVKNQQSVCAQREALLRAGSPDVIPLPTPQQLIADMVAMANGNQADLLTFSTLYTVGNILGMVYGTVPLPP